MNNTPPPPRRVILGLGSNLGNRLANLQDALRRASPFLREVAVSSLYESDPVGPPGQPPYYNAVAAALTTLAPAELLASLKQIERALGRRPGPRWGPRSIDLDILWMEGVSIATMELTIPHPRIAERPFVLIPLAEVAPTLALGDAPTVAALAAAADRSGLYMVAGPEWRTATRVVPIATRPDPSTL